MQHEVIKTYRRWPEEEPPALWVETIDNRLFLTDVTGWVERCRTIRDADDLAEEMLGTVYVTIENELYAMEPGFADWLRQVCALDDAAFERYIAEMAARCEG